MNGGSHAAERPDEECIAGDDRLHLIEGRAVAANRPARGAGRVTRCGHAADADHAAESQDLPVRHRYHAGDVAVGIAQRARVRKKKFRERESKDVAPLLDDRRDVVRRDEHLHPLLGHLLGPLQRLAPTHAPTRVVIVAVRVDRLRDLNLELVRDGEEVVDRPAAVKDRSLAGGTVADHVDEVGGLGGVLAPADLLAAEELDDVEVRRGEVAQPRHRDRAG